MDSNGMMAVVRGLPDSGLMVTLMDGGKQYTLMPKSGLSSSPTYEVCNNCLSRQSQCGTSEVRPRQDSGAQAVDGRYASSYKIEYCNLRPTSPPVELTEFPPQRARLQPGRGNFEVGGIGSGGSTPRATGKRTYSNCRAVAAAANIPQSKSNAFASSLRRYPSVGPEPSSEVFERLISYTKPSDSSRINSPKDCLTCYQVTPTTRYPRLKHFEHKRHYDVSPTRYDSLLPHEYENLCKYHEHINDMYYGTRGIDSKSPFHRMNSQNMRMRGSKVDAASVIATLNESSYVNLPSSKLDSEENLVKGKSSNVTLEAIHIRPNSLKDNKSMQTFNSLIELRPKRKTKAHRKPKKAKITNPSPSKRKILTRKSKQEYGSPCEHKTLKSELLELIKELNNLEEDEIEEKLKEVLRKILNCILKQRKHNSKDNLIHDLIKQCDVEKVDCDTESVDFKTETLDLVWQKYSNEASKIQRVIKDDLLPILKYHLFKEHENDVVNFILSKIIKDIVGVASKIEYKYIEQSRNSLQHLRHLEKLKGIDNKSQQSYQRSQEQCKKCRRYPIAIRNLGKTKTVDNLNKNINNQSNESIDLELQSIVNIYQVLKKIQSSSEFQANYVTSMLLNRFCTTKAYDNDLKNVHRKTKPCMSPPKCISDTYIMIHDSSRNKAILTKKKMDKMNLHGSTKLLTSIKNKHTVETSVENDQKNQLENVNDPEKPQTTRQDAAQENDNAGLVPNKRSKTEIKSQIDENSNNSTILQQIENKIRQWFMKFGIYTITNNVCYDNVLRNLTAEITTQLKLLNQQSTDTTKESVADFLKCVICKHLFLPMTGRNFELAHKLSELTKDVLRIFNSNTPENRQIKAFHEQSTTHFASQENEHNLPKPPTILPGSYYKADKNVMKDIYSKIMFCDENILKILPRDLLKQEAECSGEKYISSECQSSAKNPDEEDTKNKPGEIKIVLTTTNTNKTENTANAADTATAANDNNDVSEPNSSIQQNQNVREIPENATRQQLHEYCVETFRNYCKELPIIATNPDLTELAREGVLHNILKLFYMLIEDSHIQNDYTYFEFTFEDEIDGLLDILPQTEEMKKMRQGWKAKIVIEAVKILKYMHKTKDDSEFQQKLNQVSDRRKLMVEQRLDDEYSQQLSALRMAEKYMAATNYHEQNPLKMKVYMQRLMKRTNQIYECVKRKEGKPFLELPIESINEIVFKELQGVPIPNNDIEKQEMNLVEINNEIDAWFNELPVVPTEGINVNRRKILKHTLANKIHGMDMNLNLDSPGAEREMKHEISVFLSDKAIGLEKDQDLNINYMVEDLSRRLKRRRERQNSLDYESFKKQVPFNSSVQKIENSSQVQEFDRIPYSNQNVRLSKNGERVRFEDQIPNEDKIVKLQPIRRSIDRGVLGTSQTPGPSSDEAYLTLSPCPRNCNSRTPPRYPNTSNLTSSSHQRSKILAPQELNEISQFFGGSPNGIKAGHYRSPVDQQRSDYYSMRDHPLHRNSNPNNFFYDPRSKTQYGPNGAMSTTQAAPPYGKPVNYKSVRYDRDDYDMDYDSDRDSSRLRCKCGEPSMRRRRRRSCHCEDFYPMPSCCFLHNDF